jgi:hypothetical protein
MLDLIGKANVFLATGIICEAGNVALRTAKGWLAENSNNDEPEGVRGNS